MAHVNNSIVHAAVGLVFGGGLFVKGMRVWNERRRLMNKPTAKVDSVAMGDAELCGQVKAEKVLQSPFSGLDCVYCSYKVEEPQKNGWRVIEKGHISSIFYLDDGTGSILVNPEGADFYGAETFERILSGEDIGVAPGMAFWMANREQSSLFGSLVIHGPYRFTEYAIFPGQDVFVEGNVSKARHVVNGREREEKMVGQRASGHFLLSGYNEQKLLSDLAWKAPLQILGGAGLLLGCLWYLVSYFHIELYV
jgi:hypothetical protein